MKNQSGISTLVHDHSALIRLILEAAMACEKCTNACLREPDVTMFAKCIQLDIDCADICRQAAALLQRGSDLSHEFLMICEKACRLCALECSKHTHEHCIECTRACQECADACHAH